MFSGTHKIAGSALALCFSLTAAAAPASASQVNTATAVSQEFNGFKTSDAQAGTRKYGGFPLRYTGWGHDIASAKIYVEQVEFELPKNVPPGAKITSISGRFSIVNRPYYMNPRARICGYRYDKKNCGTLTANGVWEQQSYWTGITQGLRGMAVDKSTIKVEYYLDDYGPANHGDAINPYARCGEINLWVNYVYTE